MRATMRGPSTSSANSASAIKEKRGLVLATVNVVAGIVSPHFQGARVTVPDPLYKRFRRCDGKSVRDCERDSWLFVQVAARRKLQIIYIYSMLSHHKPNSFNCVHGSSPSSLSAT